ncbi:MAG TPA: ATP-binding protein [Bacillota bacterium]|nr:ATP-binding protein [Bacillota bacterium]
MAPVLPISREKALVGSEDLFSKAFKLSPTPMCITKRSDGRIIDVNESFHRMMGFTREEMVGRTSIDLKIWPGKGEREQVLSELKQQGLIRNKEILLVTKSGEERVALASFEMVGVNGEDHMLGVFVDLTERIRMDKEMNRLERLHLIGEMAASIGHEIRNPLTSVRGFLQVLSEKDACLIYRDFFGLMIDELDRANSIISEFLALAKNRSIELKLQNLNPIIATLFPLIMADSANSDTVVNLDLKGTPQLMLDEKEIRQLVLNLVRNGKEAMVKGGNLTIRSYQEGDEVILAVEDQGPGIPPNIIENLGTPFFTTKEAGTGLGLAVCYSIVARHRAVMDFNTGPEGTTFLVRFRVPDKSQRKLSTEPN